MTTVSGTPTLMDVEAFRIWHIEYPVEQHIRVGSELRGRHYAVLLGESAAMIAFRSIVHAPISGRLDRQKNPKKIVIAFNLPQRSLPLLSKDSLVLVCMLDSLEGSCLDEYVTQARARSTNEIISSPEAQAALRLMISQVVFDRFPGARPAYRIGPHAIARGTVLKLRSEGAPKGTPWVVVSSSMWLNLLQSLSGYAGVAGLVRDLVHVVRIIEGQSPPADQLVVPIPNPPPGIATPAYACFHRFRTRSMERVVEILPGVEQSVLDDIDCGLGLLLGLGMPSVGSPTKGS